MKIAFTTLGCKVNQYETQALKESFSEKGFEVVSEETPSDICVINTCSVTNLSDRKSRQAIRRFKKNNPEAVIVVAGCYAQTGTVELKGMEEVDIIVGTNEKHRLPELVETFVEEKKQLIAVRQWEEIETFEELGTIEVMEGRTRAFIKIQEGCDRFCAYCIIPYARGRVRSRGEAEILAEVHALLEKGYKEIVLTGINTALYGVDEVVMESADEGHSRLWNLIGKINGIPGDFRIRLSSLEPTVINVNDIKALLQYEKLCPHVHLSVQSGSDNVLKTMNRRYNRAEYIEIVEALKAHDPLFGITTDIIIGFPGETEAQFQDSIRLASEIDFCKIHVFRYSKRNGTKAAQMEGQIPPHIKNDRSEKMIIAAETSKERFLLRNIGAVRSVLFEEMVQDGKYAVGMSDNYIKVYLETRGISEENFINCIKNIKLEAPFLDGIKGRLV